MIDDLPSAGIFYSGAVSYPSSSQLW